MNYPDLSKFRCWSKLNDYWIPPENFMVNINGTVDSREFCSYIYTPETCEKLYALMQFIGDKDSTGKDIYEKDIVANGNYIFKIENQLVYYHLGGNAFSFRGYDLRGYKPDELTIIGNEFDNPELLSELAS